MTDKPASRLDYQRVARQVRRFVYHVPLYVLVVLLLMAVIGPLLPLHPDAIALSKILLPPGQGSLLGYDDLGRSIFDRVILGAETSLVVAVWVIVLSLIIGVTVGLLSGYYGGWFDQVTVRIIDIFLAFPGILLAIGLAGVMGPGIENVVVALATVGWVGYARLTRAQVLSLKHREHVLAAVALGTPPIRIIGRHLLPLISAPLIVEATFGIAGVVIAEAGLSFLGLGVQPPDASWGNMIKEGARYMLVAPHMVLAPGCALMLVVLAVNLAGDSLRDWMDVKTRRTF
jgi:peptide/nickel transport system permease protein